MYANGATSIFPAPNIFDMFPLPAYQTKRHIKVSNTGQPSAANLRVKT